MKKKSPQARMCEKIARRAIVPKGSTMTEVIMRYRQYRGKRRKYHLPLLFRIQDNIDTVFSHDLQLFYMNPESTSDTLIIYLHGGAYVSEMLPFHWMMLDKLTRMIDAAFIIPDYPLAPYSDFRECYDKMTVFYRKCLQYYSDRRIILMGDSAGGGLAMGLTMYWGQLGLRKPDSLILLSPWVDLNMDNPDIRNYLKDDPMLKPDELKIDALFWAGTEDMHDYRLSPIYGDMSQFNDVTIFAGTSEIFFPDLLKTHQLLDAAGVKNTFIVGEGLYHVYPAFPIPEADEAIETISRIIHDRA